MSSTVALVDTHPVLATMLRRRGEQAHESEESGGELFIMDLMERILSAETVDDVFAAQESGLVSGKEFTNRPFIIMNDDDIVWRKSDDKYTAQSGFPLYVMLRVRTLDTNEEITLSCGGKTFLAVLDALQVRGYFKDSIDGQSLIIFSTESPNGAFLSLMPFKRPEPARGKNK